MRAFLAAIAASLILLSLPAKSHDGHDHGGKPVQESANAKSSARAAASSDQFELVAVSRGLFLEIYVDAFATNEPVSGATIEVETPDGPAKADATSDQTYKLQAPWLSKAQSADLIFTVTANGVTDILPLTILLVDARAPANLDSTKADWIQRFGPVAGGILAVLLVLAITKIIRLRRSRLAAVTLACLLLVTLPCDRSRAHDGHDHGEVSQPIAVPKKTSAQRLSDGSLFVPKPAQRIFAVRTALTESKAYRRRVELPGRIIPDPNASGFVQAAAGGRLTPPPGGFPRLGTIVKQGDVLAYVTPPLQAIDVSDMRQRRGELDQQIAIMQDRLARFQTLAPSGAIARSQVEETRIELEGLKERRSMLERSQREPEALLAPVSGSIAEGSAVAGQIVQPSAVVFQIIDPKRLWVEALSFESIGGATGAMATTSQGTALKLEFRGSGLTDRSQSIPVHFAIAENDAQLRVGQFVNVIVPVEDEREGLAIPRSSIVRAPGGGDMVFEHTGAEIFTPHLIRVEPLDADNVLVSSGLAPGKRIVTQGAELLDHIR